MLAEKPCVVALGAGLPVGAIHSVLGVRSPTPPVIALIGLLGILAGERAVSPGKRLVAERALDAGTIREDCGRRMFAAPPHARDAAGPVTSATAPDAR